MKGLFWVKCYKKLNKWSSRQEDRKHPPSLQVWMDHFDCLQNSSPMFVYHGNPQPVNLSILYRLQGPVEFKVKVKTVMKKTVLEVKVAIWTIFSAFSPHLNIPQYITILYGESSYSWDWWGKWNSVVGITYWLSKTSKPLKINALLLSEIRQSSTSIGGVQL